MIENLVFDYLLVKLAARCNINCSYCYWFRDETVYKKPSLMPLVVENALVKKLTSHIVKHQLNSFTLLFHGGEPLLFGKERFLNLLKKIKKIEQLTSCKFSFAITTNAILIDKEWLSIFYTFNVRITVSLDGNDKIHNENRKDFKDNGTYHVVVDKINLLKSYNFQYGVLAVCNPKYDPYIVFDHFTNELGLRHFDILFPDENHDSKKVDSISEYYKKLFDIWYYHNERDDIHIRILNSFVVGLLGIESRAESLGYGPLTTATVLTDGSLEALDVLRATSPGFTKSEINITTNEIQDIKKDKLWIEAYKSSLNLAKKCTTCQYRFACGGGYLPQRWSKENRFNNPNVYCNDLIEIFEHVSNILASEIDFAKLDDCLSKKSIISTH